MAVASRVIDALIDVAAEQRRRRATNPIATQVLDWLIDLSALVGAFLVLFMASSIGLNVLLRRVFHAPLDWALPITEFSLLWITFMAAPVVLRREGHVRMTAITELLSDRPKFWLYVIGSIVGAVVCGILTWQTFETTMDQFRSGSTLLQGIEVKRALVSWVIPYGFTLLGLQFVRMTVNALRSRQVVDVITQEVEIEEEGL